MMTFFDVAMPLRQKGCKVFPCDENKKPYNGLKWGQLPDMPEADFTRWAQQFPIPMAGLMTGTRSGVWVLDVDVPKKEGEADGRETLEALERAHGSLPDTFTVATPSGGRHLYFTMPRDGQDVRNSVKILPGIDVRGSGGYVIAPGSTLPDGRAYTVTCNAPPALAEDWLLSMVRKSQSEERRPSPRPATGMRSQGASQEGERQWALKALEDECRKVREEPEGSRNATLNTAALKVFQIVAGGALSEEEARQALMDAGLASGLTEQETRATIASGRAAGLKEPRYYPGPAIGEARPVEWQAPVWFDTVDFQELDIALVPSILGDFCAGLSEALQISVEMPFGAATAVVSAAGQYNHLIQVKPGHIENMGLYNLILLGSGERKSPTVAICKQPLEEWEKEAGEKLAPILREAKIDEDLYMDDKRDLMQKRRKCKDPQKKEEYREEIHKICAKIGKLPQEPTLIVEDTTSEALADVLAENYGFASVFSAEGGLFDTMGGRYSDGIPNIDIYLKGYSGESHKVNRKSSPSVRIERCQMTMCIAMQPDLLKNRRTGNFFRSKGLDARFFYLFPREKVGCRNVRNPKPLDELIKQRFFAKIRSLLPDPEVWIKEAPKQTKLQFSDDALEAWISFAEKAEKEMRSFAGYYGMKDWGAKFPGGVARLAGVFHLLEHDNPEKVKITRKTAEQAIYAGSILVEHAKYAYGVMGADESLERAKIVLSWIQINNKDRFSFRDAQQLLKNRIAFGGSNTLEDALKELEERRFVQSIQIEKGGKGRPRKPDYIVNPAALRGHGNE